MTDATRKALERVDQILRDAGWDQPARFAEERPLAPDGKRPKRSEEEEERLLHQVLGCVEGSGYQPRDPTGKERLLHDLKALLDEF